MASSAAALALAVLTAATVSAQSQTRTVVAGGTAASGATPGGAEALPFRVGETLTFRASMPILGRIGTGTMSVGGPEDVQDTKALLLRFDFAGRAGLFRLADTTRSWIEPHGFSALRYEKREDSPLGGRSEAVQIDRAAQRWVAADGSGGALPTDAPLDELSFLFYVRTLPLEDGATYRLMRHFDARRNPVTFRVVRRERVRVPAGEFASVLVEMRVTDPARYQGEGTIMLHLSDDALRIPLRIASSVPGAGRITFSLEAFDAITAAAVGGSLTPRAAARRDSTTP
jgi:hypothetical protein